MSRTADITVLAKASHALLIRLKQVGATDPDLEAVEMDMDTLGILLTELQGSQLKRENIQWVLWHLLEHVMEEVHGTFEGAGIPDTGEGDESPSDKEDWDALDDYITAFEEKLTTRAKIVCPRLEALLGDHWMEADEAEQGSKLLPEGEEPGEDEPEPEPDGDEPEE